MDLKLNLRSLELNIFSIAHAIQDIYQSIAISIYHLKNLKKKLERILIKTLSLKISLSTYHKDIYDTCTYVHVDVIIHLSQLFLEVDFYRVRQLFVNWKILCDLLDFKNKDKLICKYINKWKYIVDKIKSSKKLRFI
jgi:hypothetical protein